MEDLEGWEVLPEGGFLEIHEEDDDDGKKFFSRKYTTTAAENVFKNYFICPSSEFVETTEEAAMAVVPVPIQLEEAAVVEMPQDDDDDQHGLQKEVIMIPLDSTIRPSSAVPELIITGEADQQVLLTQVFFKEMKETELFVDMKMDSPKSIKNDDSAISWGIKPQSDAGSFQFDDQEEAGAPDTLETTKISSPRRHKIIDDEDKMIDKNNQMDAADIATKEVVNWQQNSGGPNVFKWSFLSGIGAICSFGVATVCVLLFGGFRRNKEHQNKQKVEFHFYTQDERLKQMVQRATKLNEAISAARGVPITRANITVGGYYHTH